MTIDPKKTAYGAGPVSRSIPGLVWAYQFSPAGMPETFVPEDSFTLSATSDGFVWIHLDLIDARAIRWCEQQKELAPEDIKQLLTGVDPHLRLEHLGNVLYGVLLDRAETLSGESGEKAFIRFAAGPKWLVTGRRQPAQSAQAINQKLHKKLAVANPSRLIELIIENILDGTSKSVGTIAGEIDRIEDSLLDNRRLGNEEPLLARLRRQSVHLHRELLGLRVIFRRFAEFGEEMKLPAETITAAARILQRIDTMHGDVHVVQERAHMLQERFAGQVAAEINRNLYVLSIISSIMLPSTFVFGLWGVNAGGVPFSAESYGFWIILGLGLTASFAFYQFFIRKRS